MQFLKVPQIGPLIFCKKRQISFQKVSFYNKAHFVFNHDTVNNYCYLCLIIYLVSELHIWLKYKNSVQMSHDTILTGIKEIMTMHIVHFSASPTSKNSNLLELQQHEYSAGVLCTITWQINTYLCKALYDQYTKHHTSIFYFSDIKQGLFVPN